MKKYSRMFFCLLVACLFLAVSMDARHAFAADPVFIDTNANGALDVGELSFTTITEVVTAAVAGDTIYVPSGTHDVIGQVLIDKNLTIAGNAADKPVIRPTANLAGNNVANAWFLVAPDVTFTLSDVVLDGTTFFIWQAIRSHGNTAINRVDFRNIQGSLSGSPYRGIAVESFGGTIPGGGGSDTHIAGGAASTLTVTDSTFMQIGRIGVLVKGTESTATITGNTYTGKGNGDFLDYAFEAGAGGSITAVGNTISGNRGVASDGSTSAGILVTDFFGTGTDASVNGNTFSGNTTGLHVGYDGTDASVVSAHENDFSGETVGILSTAPVVDASNNWWGTGSGGLIGAKLSGSGAVTVEPWYVDSAQVVLSDALPTLHIIKLLVNGNGGTAVPSDFTVHVKVAGVDVAGSPVPGAAAPGTSYSLPAGTYTISEVAYPSYVLSFGGACAADGTVTLVAGDDKICTIINTDIPPPEPVPAAALAAPVSDGGGGGGGGGGRGSRRGQSPPLVPLIGLLKVPVPLSLPGSGSVTYNYTVWNVEGAQALTDVAVTNDKCYPVTLRSGDVNDNGKLDPEESWKYSCTTALAETTTNTTVVTAFSDDGFRQAAIAGVIATVVVGEPIAPPLIAVVKVPSRLTPFAFGGGDVAYTYTVTNSGVVPINSVSVTDDGCSAVSRVSGDADRDNLLDPTEAWIYSCRTNVAVSTRSIATVEGRVNGLVALGYGFANVLVAAPGFPAAGTVSPSDQQIRSITVNLTSGRRGNDVKILQQFLISRNTGKAAQALARPGATGYFGPLTRAALAEFQAKAGIRPAVGYFGPITRAYIWEQ